MNNVVLKVNLVKAEERQKEGGGSEEVDVKERFLLRKIQRENRPSNQDYFSLLINKLDNFINN